MDDEDSRAPPSINALPSPPSLPPSPNDTAMLLDDSPIETPLTRIAEEMLLASAAVPEPPAPDYFHKVGSPLSAWTGLEPGLEVQEEGELVWSVRSWTELSALEKVDSPCTVDLAGFKWYYWVKLPYCLLAVFIGVCGCGPLELSRSGIGL